MTFIWVVEITYIISVTNSLPDISFPPYRAELLLILLLFQADDCTSGECASGSVSGASDQQDDDGKDDGRDGKKKKNRCATCRKKVGLTGFQCRCGGLYCAVHRYSDKHDCSFDYREMGAQEIRRNNPVVVGEKIQKIWGAPVAPCCALRARPPSTRASPLHELLIVQSAIASSDARVLPYSSVRRRHSQPH